MGRPAFIAEKIFLNGFKKDGDCWEWTKRILQTGYGEFRANYIDWAAHRFSYIYYKGEIPKGYHVHHVCENRKCVNPKHLTIMTAREHTLIGNGEAGINYRKTHCIHDHEFTGTNTYITPDGRRNCKKCRSLHMRKWLNKIGVN